MLFQFTTDLTRKFNNLGSNLCADIVNRIRDKALITACVQLVTSETTTTGSQSGQPAGSCHLRDQSLPGALRAYQGSYLSSLYVIISISSEGLFSAYINTWRLSEQEFLSLINLGSKI